MYRRTVTEIVNPGEQQPSIDLDRTDSVCSTGSLETGEGKVSSVLGPVSGVPLLRRVSLYEQPYVSYPIVQKSTDPALLKIFGA